MKPLNYAILKHFVCVEEASADDIMEALEKDYGHFKAFNKAAVLTSLMTAEANLLLEESKSEFDDDKNIRVYYRANEDGKKLINTYITD